MFVGKFNKSFHQHFAMVFLWWFMVAILIVYWNLGGDVRLKDVFINTETEKKEKKKNGFKNKKRKFGSISS